MELVREILGEASGFIIVALVLFGCFLEDRFKEKRVQKRHAKHDEPADTAP